MRVALGIFVGRKENQQVGALDCITDPPGNQRTRFVVAWAVLRCEGVSLVTRMTTSSSVGKCSVRPARQAENLGLWS